MFVDQSTQWVVLIEEDELLLALFSSYRPARRSLNGALSDPFLEEIFVSPRTNGL